MKITLIRHTSVAVSSGICYGQTDVQVAETFESEALQVFQKISDLSFDAVYSSPLIRCRKLADYCGFPSPVTDNRLMELNFGDWEMQAWNNITDQQLQNWYTNWIDEQPTNGESFRQMISRVADFLAELKAKDYQHVAIFTHAGVIRAMGIINQELSIEKAFDYKIEYGDVIQWVAN